MTFTPQEYAELLRKQINDLVTINQPFLIGVSSLLAETSERIFTNGGSSDGGKIGQYQSGENPLYVNTKNVLRKELPAKGKSGKDKFKNGKAHKTTYFANYKGLRSDLGLNSAFVDMNLTGNLKSDYENGLNQINANEITIEVSAFNKDKIDGNEARFTLFIQNTKQEIHKLIDDIQFETLRILNGNS